MKVATGAFEILINRTTFVGYVPRSCLEGGWNFRLNMSFQASNGWLCSCRVIEEKTLRLHGKNNSLTIEVRRRNGNDQKSMSLKISKSKQLTATVSSAANYRNCFGHEKAINFRLTCLNLLSLWGMPLIPFSTQKSRRPRQRIVTDPHRL